MFDFVGFLNDQLSIIKLCFYAIYYYLEVIIKHFLLPKRFVYKDISGNVVLLTGAAGGIGKCLAKDLLKQGCSLICVDISKKLLDKLKNELETEFQNLDTRVFYYPSDISSLSEVNVLVEKIKKEIGKVDILINNAGIMNKGKLLTELSDNEIENIFNVNVLSQFWLCKAFLPGMIERNYGHIVNLSSSLSIYGLYKLTDYCATKFAVFGFSEALRVELKVLGKDEIKVTIVCPFHVKTPLFNGYELPTLKWSPTSVTAEEVSYDVVDGILLNKELVGTPSFSYWSFAASKKL